LPLSGLSWLEAWITYALRNTLGFLSLSWLDRLEKPLLLLAIFHFAAYTKSREQCRLRFWRLRWWRSRGL